MCNESGVAVLGKKWTDVGIRTLEDHAVIFVATFL